MLTPGYDIVGDLFLIPNIFSYAGTANVVDFSVDLHLTYGLNPRPVPHHGDAESAPQALFTSLSYKSFRNRM